MTTSVALVVLDTLRKDAFDEYFDWLPGRRFENTISTSHWTAPVHASMFTGRYPSELGVIADAPSLDCQERTLAEQLKDAGYMTRAFSSNPYISKTFEFDRGFQQFTGSWRVESLDPDLFDWNEFIDDTKDMGPRRFPLAVLRCLTSDCDTFRSLRHGLLAKLQHMGVGWSNIKDDGAKSALSYIHNTRFGEQEFLFVNLMEAHGPYKPPKNYRSTDVPEFDKTLATVQGTNICSDQVRNAYDDSVQYLSDIYSDIFAELQDSFDIVITVADHGELFGEHGSWGHLYGVFPELVHVPMVISGNGYSGTTTETVSLMDVYPTILDIAGLSSDQRAKSLIDQLTDRDVLTEFHSLQPEKREKLRRAEIPEEKIQRYNKPLNGIGFASGYYGWETLDGFDEQGDPGFQDPLSVLEDVRSSLDRRTVEGENELSEAVESQLEELGYM